MMAFLKTVVFFISGDTVWQKKSVHILAYSPDGRKRTLNPQGRHDNNEFVNSAGR